MCTPKGVSRKEKAAVLSESQHVTSVETQTDDFKPTETASVSTQTDVVVVEFKDAAIQTDSDSLQVGHTNGDGQCTNSGELESTLYEGNSDEKIHSINS